MQRHTMSKGWDHVEGVSIPKRISFAQIELISSRPLLDMTFLVPHTPLLIPVAVLNLRRPNCFLVSPKSQFASDHLDDTSQSLPE
jgi:hypothetical protein